MLYTAKGTASLLVPFTSFLSSSTGSWHLVFYIAAAMNAVAAVLALVALKPMRLRMARGDAGSVRTDQPVPVRPDAATVRTDNPRTA